MKRSSRNRLNHRHLEHFTGDTLFDRIARTVCHADCLPRKELYESWEVARRIHRRIKGKRVLDLACGHGLAAQILLLLDRTIPEAIAIDKTLPQSATTLAAKMTEQWPVLDTRLHFVEADITAIEAAPEDLLVSVHGCGSLTETIIDMACSSQSAVALLPCCHDLKRSDTGNLEGWLEPTLAVDVTRVSKLRNAGYTLFTQTIPGDITSKNRLIMAIPG